MSKLQSSITFPIWVVNDMGPKSSSIVVGGEIFGTGTNYYRSFQGLREDTLHHR